MAYGFYKVGQSNRQRRGEKAEHFDARAALVPFLQVGLCSALLHGWRLVLCSCMAGGLAQTLAWLAGWRRLWGLSIAASDGTARQLGV